MVWFLPSVFPCLPETGSSLGLGESYCQSALITTSCCHPSLTCYPGLGDRHERVTALVPVNS